MGAFGVVVRAPGSQRGAGMVQRRKQGFVQEFVPQTTWCDCGGRSPVANEVRYVGLMYIRREENDLWNIMLVWMCH